ncbi:MAG TPA: histidine kinase [Leptolyngbyaceae cyanobacterium M33_DOE_097]|uniref:Histidine kinase n=1 Tax=Oscillatoriales cyanobacterium SpSt-418 TaxID=2282169 RepID=A0A7C3KGY3_9CYAN|nr:histidine kinase [Leptolyngbyaceae cyanobacterium M33_DOE_097]
MTYSVKEKVVENLQKAKQEGNLRIDRIREIVKSAVAQALTEVKAGSGEIKTIAKDAVSGVTEVVKEKGESAKDEVVASIEGAIEGISGVTREQLAQRKAQLDVMQAELQAEEQVLDAEINTALVELENSTETSNVSLKSLLQAAIASIRERQFTQLKQQYVHLQTQLGYVDEKLAERYGDRYTEVKHQLENAKTWYETNKSKVEAGEPNMVDQKQAQWSETAADVGTKAAHFEDRIKHQIKTWLYQTADKL